MRTRHVTLTAVALLIVAALLPAKEEPAGSIPSAMVDKLIDQDVAFIQKTLAKAKLIEKNARKAKAAALLIAVYSQIGQEKNAARRDTALKLIAAIDTGKGHKDLADTLRKTKGGGEAGPVAFNKHLKLEYLMRAFSSTQVGGFGLEKDLEALGEIKGELPGAEKDKALVVAYKTLAIAYLTHSYLPEQDEGAKTKKAWLELSKQMHKNSLNLVQAINSGKGISAASDKLATTCTKCHDVFR
ncbi:MAG: hypothetical protein FJ271_16805 [Planctomycetes bacterium]|nr:hypothetical protein [Planctomycetota bacterium]